MAAPTSRTRHAAVAGVLVNFLLFGFGFLLWERLFYGCAPEAMYMAACFLAMGALLRLWSSKRWMVIVPSAAGYLWGWWAAGGPPTPHEVFEHRGNLFSPRRSCSSSPSCPSS